MNKSQLQFKIKIINHYIFSIEWHSSEFFSYFTENGRRIESCGWRYRSKTNIYDLSSTYSVFVTIISNEKLKPCSHPIDKRSRKSNVGNLKSIKLVHSHFEHVFHWISFSWTAWNWSTCYCYYQQYHYFVKMHFQFFGKKILFQAFRFPSKKSEKSSKFRKIFQQEAFL